MLQPWDMQVWKAVPLPRRAKYVPANAVICTRKGAGACRIRGADYDGDTFMSSDHPTLLKFMNAKPDGRIVPEFTAAGDKVRAQLAKTAAQPCTSSSAYREYCCTVNTMPVRGLACMYAEMGQELVYNSLSPAEDGSFVKAIALAECAHAANGCPKKYDPSTVVTLARQLLANAGLHVQSWRSSRTAKLKLQVCIDDPLVTLAAVSGQQKAKSLGRVSVPCPRVCLSSSAGEALRERLRRRRRWGEGMELEAERVPLDELGGLIAHRLLKGGAGTPLPKI